MPHKKHVIRVHEILSDLFEHSNHPELEPENYPERVYDAARGAVIYPREMMTKIRSQLYAVAEQVARAKFLLEAHGQHHMKHFDTAHDTRDEATKRVPPVKVDRKNHGMAE